MRSRTATQHIKATTAVDAKAWAKHFGCSVAELRIALRAVGNNAERVRGYLSDLRGSLPAGTTTSPREISGEIRPLASVPSDPQATGTTTSTER